MLVTHFGYVPRDVLCGMSGRGEMKIGVSMFFFGEMGGSSASWGSPGV